MTNRVIPVLEPTAIDSRLEYSIAFDLAAARVAESDSIASGVALVASSPIFVREWLPRATGSFTIIAESSSVASVARRMVDYGTTPPRNVAAVVQAESASELAESQLSAAVWASPRPGTWRSLFAILDATLVSGASIVVLTAGRLGPLVGGIRRGLTPGEPRLPIRGLDREIEYRGYRLENVFAIGGVEAIRWAALGRMANLVGRPDLADRCEAGYRLALVPRRGGQVGLFTLIAARKTRQGA